MMRERAGYSWCAALVAGAVLRLCFLHLRPQVAGDALMYGDLAHNLLAHHIFGFSTRFSAQVVRPTLIRLPGYPLFLAACFAVFGTSNYLAVFLVQMAVDLAGCALLSGLAKRLAGKRAGLAVVWLAALCPFTANYTVVALAETLTVFCIAVAFFALERWDARSRAGEASLGWAAVVGAALAYAVLLRPDQGLLAAAIIPVMLWVSSRRGGRTLANWLMPAVVASLIVAFPLTMWAARNWRTFHVVQPLTPRYANDPDEVAPLGFQRWFRTWAIDYKATYDIYWNYDDTRMSLTDLPPRAFDDAQQMEQTRALFAQYNKVKSATPAFDKVFAQLAQQRIDAHPLRYYVVLPMARELDMWLRPRLELTIMPVDWWNVRAHPTRSAEEIAYALLNAAYLALAMVGILRWRRHAWSGRGAVAFAMFGFFVLRCLLLLTLDNSEPRYTLECFPLVILLAGIARMPRSTAFND
jgi:4-amino-4-deoxy-L-arabinose transferase-like glycosyltransferase